MKCNKVTLTKLQYDVIFSEMGLAKGRTEERVVWQKSFFVLAEAEQGGGDGKYGVRMFSDAEDLLSWGIEDLTSKHIVGMDEENDTHHCPRCGGKMCNTLTGWMCTECGAKE